jgi:hypothetical protein
MNNTCIITTIGQLNFFKWFISKKIFDFLLEKKNDVYNDMNKKNKKDAKIIKKIYNNNYKKKDKNQIEIYKKPLIINPMKDNKQTINILVSFD